MIKTIRISHGLRNDFFAKLLISRINLIQYRFILYLYQMTYGLCRDSLIIENMALLSRGFGYVYRDGIHREVRKLRLWKVVCREENRYWINLNLDEWACPTLGDASEMRAIISRDVRKQIWKK